MRNGLEFMNAFSLFVQHSRSFVHLIYIGKNVNERKVIEFVYKREFVYHPWSFALCENITEGIIENNHLGWCLKGGTHLRTSREVFTLIQAIRQSADCHQTIFNNDFILSAKCLFGRQVAITLYNFMGKGSFRRRFIESWIEKLIRDSMNHCVL